MFNYYRIDSIKLQLLPYCNTIQVTAKSLYIKLIADSLVNCVLIEIDKAA
jgi:hypothetical protein